MKKVLLTMLGAGIILTSCTSDEPFATGEGGEKQVTFTINVPESLSTRADLGNKSDKGGVTNQAGELAYTLVLSANGDEQVLTQSTRNSSATFSPTVVLGRNYTVTAYAHFGDELKDLTAIEESKGINDESKDAYFGQQTLVFEGGDNVKMDLKRPYAKLRLVATDYSDAVAIKNVKVSYANEQFTAFNAVKGEFSGTTAYSKEYSSETLYYAAEEDGSQTIFADYIPVNETGYAPFTIEVTYANGNESFTRTFTQDIPVKRNALTTLKGNFFKANAAITVNVIDDFDSKAEYPTEGNIYFVDAENTFESVIEQIGTDAPEYATIYLNSDAVYTTGVKYETDKLQGATTKTKKVTINGNNHKITFGGGGVDAIEVANDGVLVINDATIVDESEYMSENGHTAWEFTYLEFGAKTEFNNCVFQNTVMFQGTSVVVNNSKFLDQVTYESNEGNEYAAWIASGVAKFENCTFTGARGLKMHDEYGATNITEVTINNCIFDQLTKKPGVVIGFMQSAAVVNITNNQFILCQPGDQKLYIYESDTDVNTFTLNLKNNEVVNKVVEIANATQLVEFANAVNNGNGYGATLIRLSADIDLAGIDWTPIGQTGGYGAKTYFQGIFDGNGKTIRNLNVTNWEEGTNGGANFASGLFGFVDAADAKIKNLTIDGATVEGHHWCGVIAGYFSGTIDNCHVKNATVVCSHANSEACGDKAGMVVGYVNSGKVSNCTATDGIVKAGRDAGQVVGCAKSDQVENCSATNVVVSALGDCPNENNITNDIIGRLN